MPGGAYSEGCALRKILVGRVESILIVDGSVSANDIVPRANGSLDERLIGPHAISFVISDRRTY